jgi:hypothetical protein
LVKDTYQKAIFIFPIILLIHASLTVA